MGRSEDKVDERLFLKSVARTFRVLEAFGTFPHPLSLSELAAAAGVDKSAAQRIAQTLLNLGYFERAPNNGGLLPGKRLLDRSFDYLRTNPLVERATPLLIGLRESTRERVDLSLFDRQTIVYALRLQSKRETFFATLVGRRIPTFSSAGGRACLAALPGKDAQDIIAASDRKAQTPKTITDPELIWDQVELARREGYACALEESLVGEVVIAAAIRDVRGRPVGAVHIAGSLSEWDEGKFRRRHSPLAIEAARALSS